MFIYVCFVSNKFYHFGKLSDIAGPTGREALLIPKLNDDASSQNCLFCLPPENLDINSLYSFERSELE